MSQTIEQKLALLVKQDVLSNKDLNTVMELIKPVLDEKYARLANRTIGWDRPSTDFEEAMYMYWLRVSNTIVLKWIDDTCPQAWFRPMFDSSQLKQIMSETK